MKRKPQKTPRKPDRIAQRKQERARKRAEVKAIIIESDRLKAFGERLGVRLTGFDHLGSQWGGANAAYAHPIDDNRFERVRLPYWFIRQLEAVLDGKKTA